MYKRPVQYLQGHNG